MKTRKLLILFSFLALTFVVTSCEEDVNVEEELTAVDGRYRKKKDNRRKSDHKSSKRDRCKTHIKFDEACEASSAILYAGQNTEVGSVEVTVEGDNYIISYYVDEGWCLTETHLDVEQNPYDFPHNNGGNPVIGQFEYSSSHDCAASYSYTVPVADGPFIAAHAVVTCETTSPDEIEASLPEMVNVCTTAKGVDANNAYFDLTIGDTDLAGDYTAWCVDVDASLAANQCFEGTVYSSYEALPDGKFEQAENFDKVNWIVNQDFVGKESASGGTYTFGEVQWAIWELVDDQNCVSCAYLGDWSQERAQEIYDAAMAEGAGFVPGCGDEIAIVIVPTEYIQSVIITLPIDCNECEETAWADGCEFPGRSWATYFKFQ